MGRFSAGLLIFVGVLRWRKLWSDGSARLLQISQVWLASFLFILCFAMFFSQLYLMWSHQTESGAVIAGVLPWSDARGYNSGGLYAIQDRALDEWRCRRPLSSLLMASLYSFSGVNQANVLWSLTFLAMMSTFIGGYFISRMWGIAAAFIYVLAQFYYFRPYISTTLSENMGFIFGSIAVAALLVGWETAKFSWIFAGLYTLTLALCARAGAFFVLPFLVLASAVISMRPFGWSWKRSGFATIAVVLGFVTNSLVKRVYCEPTSMAFSNFSHTLYGLSKGETWMAIKTDHPELQSLPMDQFASKVYALAWENIKAEPTVFLSTLWRNEKIYLNSNLTVFPAKYASVEILVLVLAFFLIVVSIARPRVFESALRGKSTTAIFLLSCVLGILISAPVIVADGGWRVFAASMAMHSLLLAFGITFVEKGCSQSLTPSIEIPGLSIFRIFLAAILVLLLGGPIWTLWSHKELPPHVVANAHCPEGSSLTVFRENPGSAIEIVPDGTVYDPYRFQVAESKFRQQMLSVKNHDYENFVKIAAPSTLLMNYNYLTHKEELMVVPAYLKPNEEGFYTLCSHGKMPGSRFIDVGSVATQK